MLLCESMPLGRLGRTRVRLHPRRRIVRMRSLRPSWSACPTSMLRLTLLVVYNLKRFHASTCQDVTCAGLQSMEAFKKQA